MKIIKNSIIYTAVMILKNGISFFLLPIYTLYLTTADYGIVSILTSLTQFVSILMLLSMHGAGVRFHYDYSGDREKQKSFWGNILSFVLINSALISIVLIAGHRYLVDPLFKDIPFYPYLLLGIVSCFFQAAYDVFQAHLRACQNGKAFGANNMVFFIVKVALTLTFIIVFKLSALGVILALAGTQFIFFIQSLIRFVPSVKLGIEKQYLKPTLGYALPMLPHLLAGWGMTLVDRIFLENMKSTSDVGIYSIGYQIASMIQMLTIATNEAYSPWFYEKCKEGKSGEEKVREYSEFLVIFFSVAGLFVVLFSPEILRMLVTREFEAGWIVTPFLAFGFVFRGIYFVLSGPIFLQRVRLIPFVTIFGASVNIGLNYILIGEYGMIGAAMAGTISMFLSSVLTLILSVRVKDMGFRWKSMYLWAISAFALSLSIFLLKELELPLWQMLAAKTAVGFIAAAAFFYKFRKRAFLLAGVLLKKR